MQIRKGGLRGSFARVLKDTLGDVIGENLIALSAEEKEGEWRPGVTYRKLMQDYGEGLRGIYEDVWIEAFSRDWGDRVKDLVIDDLRHPNEAEWVRSKGGVVIRVLRDCSGSTSSPDHISESGQGRVVVDATISNNGSLEDLWACIAHALGSARSCQ